MAKYLQRFLPILNPTYHSLSVFLNVKLTLTRPPNWGQIKVAGDFVQLLSLQCRLRYGEESWQQMAEMQNPIEALLCRSNSLVIAVQFSCRWR